MSDDDAINSGNERGSGGDDLGDDGGPGGDEASQPGGDQAALADQAFATALEAYKDDPRYDQLMAVLKADKGENGKRTASDGSMVPDHQTKKKKAAEETLEEEAETDDQTTPHQEAVTVVLDDADDHEQAVDDDYADDDLPSLPKGALLMKRDPIQLPKNWKLCIAKHTGWDFNLDNSRIRKDENSLSDYPTTDGNSEWALGLVYRLVYQSATKLSELKFSKDKSVERPLTHKFMSENVRDLRDDVCSFSETDLTGTLLKCCQADAKLERLMESSGDPWSLTAMWDLFLRMTNQREQPKGNWWRRRMWLLQRFYGSGPIARMANMELHTLHEKISNYEPADYLLLWIWLWILSNQPIELAFLASKINAKIATNADFFDDVRKAMSAADWREDLNKRAKDYWPKKPSSINALQPAKPGVIEAAVKAGLATETEAKDRRFRNVCVGCGQPDHWLEACPRKPPGYVGRNLNPYHQGRTETQPRQKLLPAPGDTPATTPNSYQIKGKAGRN